MRNIQIFVLSLLVCSAGFSRGAQPEWYIQLQKLEILKTRVETVVDIFGEPRVSGPSRKRFESADGILIITFSSGKCTRQKMTGYDVEEGVVEQFSFWVDKSKRVKVKDLDFDLNQFEKTEIDDVPGAFVYEDFEGGVSIGVDRNGLVESLEIEPSSKFDHLLCTRIKSD